MFNVVDIIAATGGRLLSGKKESNVNGISIDSRHVKRGQLFVAIKGDLFDGHDFIDDVIAKGVRVIVSHQPVTVSDQRVTVVIVNDTTKALGELARAYRLRFKIPVIALTGSAGKTTTKEMIASVLSKKYKVLKNEGTQNNHIGVPLTLFKLKSKHEIVVLECGTNQPGDIPWLSHIARPTTVAFTNIGEAHLEKLGSKQGVLKEKWTLTQYLPKGAKVIINADDPLLAKKGSSITDQWKAITYGIHQQAYFQANAVIINGEASLSYTVKGKPIKLNTCGLSNVYNSLIAYAFGVQFGVPAVEITKALGAFSFPDGRGQVVRLGKGWLLNDVYNANPVSMRSALQTLQAIAAPGRKVAILGDMLELGAETKKLHMHIGAAVVSSGVSVLISVGNLAQDIAREALRKSPKMQVMMARDTEEATMLAARLLKNGDAVLVKGSRRMKMENVVEFLLASPQAVLK